jgi:hypothetical protein
MGMPFDLTKLPPTLEPSTSVNGDLRERFYRRYQPRWYSPFCRHGAFRVYTEDTFPTDPAGGEGVFQRWTWKDSDDELILMTSKCLVCERVLLVGRLNTANKSGISLGALYVLRKNKFTPRPKDIPDKDLREFYDREWEFISSLLADFNKLTIAVAVAASVFFDKYPSVFYAFIVACFIMIALYAASYAAQRQISRKYYRDAGKSLTPAYKSIFATVSKCLQVTFGIAIVVVLCLMIRAERNSLMKKSEGNNSAEKTIPYNPPDNAATRTQDTLPYIPPIVVQQPSSTPPVKPPSTPPATKKD